MSDRVRALTVLVAVFLLGCLVGGGLFIAWTSRFLSPESGPFFGQPPPLQPWTAALKLTSEQELKFREIMNESRRKIDAVMQEDAPKMAAIRAEMNQKLLAILNENQKKQFETSIRRFEERRPELNRNGPRNPPSF